MRYVLTAYEDAPELVDRELEGGCAGNVKATMAFEADYLPNVLEQIRYFLLSVGFDYVAALAAYTPDVRRLPLPLKVDA